MKGRPLILLSLVLCLVSTTAILSGSEESDRIYRQSLDAYLLGNYDQAIVLAAQSLQVDPNENKAQDLLAVLVAEKERIGRSEIWIAGKSPNDGPTPVTKPEALGTDPSSVVDERVWSELKILREDVQRLRESQRKDSAKYLMTLFEQRVQVIAGLLEKSSAGQVESVRKEQALTNKRLDSIASRGTVMAGFLMVLSVLSLVFSAMALWRRGHHPGGHP
jgi:hypothetical protein